MRRSPPLIAQDHIAMCIAARDGMTRKYKTARRNGLEFMEIWDLTFDIN